MRRTLDSFSIARVLVVVVVLLASSAVASAYTLVMRSGRTVEIPNQFLVSGDNLTYEVTPGIQVSVRLVSIDIPATERANNENAGSFFQRGNPQPVSAPVDTQPRQTAKRVVTNRDLESYRARRIQSENAYEKRRIELGLPSVAESRQRNAIAAEQTRYEIKETLAEEREAEQYWRNRASSLRAEMAATDAQIQYLSARISETSDNNTFLSPGLLPFAGINSPFLGQSAFPYRGAYGGGAQVNARINLGGQGYRGRNYHGAGRLNRNYGRYGYQLPYASPFGYPVQTYDNSYERSALVMQMDEVQRQKLVLQVRWRQLEEEARRAGAYPGWLRP